MRKLKWAVISAILLGMTAAASAQSVRTGDRAIRAEQAERLRPRSQQFAPPTVNGRPLQPANAGSYNVRRVQSGQGGLGFSN